MSKRDRRQIYSINDDSSGIEIKAEDDPIKVGNLLNRHFTTIGEKLAGSIDRSSDSEEPMNDHTSACTSDDPFHRINSSDVTKIIESLRGGSCPGFDGVT
ncbi:unnamed protein product, partial [Nesidiocoris tenuis]